MTVHKHADRKLLIRSVAVAAILGSVAGVAGCDQIGGMKAKPAATSDALPALPPARLASFQPAPDVEAMPDVEAAQVGEMPAGPDAYAYAERAQALNYAFEDAPPDYGYDYDDSEAWGWETDDGYYRDVEPTDDGDRYYYYGPGEDEPFYVRDEGYGYGFNNGVLVVVYDPYGRLMPIDFVRSRAGWAGRYLWRARHLRERRHDHRWRVGHNRWRERESRFEAEHRALEQAAQQQAQWREYRERADNREREHFVAERRRRFDGRHE